MNFNRYLTLLVIVYIIGCAPADTGSNESTPTEAPKSPRALTATLSKALEAHGGLDRWSQMKTLEYDIVREDGNEHQLIDLQSRKVRLTRGDWTVGFDGADVWVTPDSAAVGRMNARFYHNLIFYFFALPYVAADPGINYEEMGEVEVNGNTYEKVLMTFDNGVGDAPDDKYVLYFGGDGLLQLINYSVTYYDKSRADRFNAIKYEDWTSVNGLLLPKTMVGYRWEGDSLGEQRYVRQFDNLKISGEAADHALFEKPEGAYVSPL